MSANPAAASQTTPTQEDVADEDVLTELTEGIVRLADPMLAPIATALGTAAFRRRSSMQLLAGDVDELAHVVTDAARFLCQRDPEEIGVRVWQPDDTGTVIDVNTEDGPFLVSTLTEELSRRGLEVRDLLHPILGVERTEDGTVTDIISARQARLRESWIHVRLVQSLGDEEQQRLREAIVAVMRDAKRVTQDFRALTTRVKKMALEAETDAVTAFPDDEATEASALLTWLLDDHFVFLGARDFRRVETDDGVRLELEQGSGLGVWSDANTTVNPATGVGLEEVTGPAGDPPPLLSVSRTTRRSTVHRNERMMHLVLQRVDESHLFGERHLVGLLSQKAFAQPATSIPVLRKKLRDILELEDIVDHSHDERSLRVLFEAIPKHELFVLSTFDLRTVLVDLMESQKQQAVRLVLQRHDGGVSVLITMPRDRFNAELRRSVQRLLTDHMHAQGVDYHLSLTEGDQALLHFTLTVDTDVDIRVDDLQRQVVELSRTWQDRLRDAIATRERRGEEGRDADVRHAVERWGSTLPATYTTATGPKEAVGDLIKLDELISDGGDVRVRVVAAGPDRLRVKLFKLGEGIELSSVLPMLESLGLVAIEEVPHRIEFDAADGAGQIAHIHSVEVRVPGVEDVDVAADGERLSSALLAIWNGQASADSLNRLVLLAGLGWSDVAVLRAYRRYRRQLGTSFTEAYQNDALCQYPAIARALIDLFVARFSPVAGERDPEGGTARQQDVDDARQRILGGLEDVTRLDQDRIIRGYLGMMDATLRTNHFIRPRRQWLSLKFDSSRVPDMPAPVPSCEIFVHSPDMEGVHLRGGSVARGGLRWSDRLEDVRTEVLGLLKAQITKNSMIVPTGSKGGFVLKRPPADGDDLREAVREQYAIFIRGMLDLTDNVVDGDVVHPEGVRADDGDDPYLVVAADRGTATFSDLANSISNEYGFWLRDAFASGGSRGYDHKRMGITARGAWETVRRHFYELDIDVQTEPITITGIGDMSGDVFGNGLRRSRSVKLVAAFDHRDIFIDPTPDPEVAFDERDRLYAMPRSTWQDYDRARISPGGGVWSRDVKSIPLSDAMRSLLRVDDDAMTPPELLRAILQAPTDLLFAGGVGTFVKASSESHDDVGDRTNDAIRVDGSDVGARVIGEGGNLAVTQRGRIEYARRGGRVNLDAIDNAAGVATSDAEVNLKILLRMALDSGEIDADERDRVLEEVREDVAQNVLHRVWRQAWAISRELSISPGGMDAYEQLLIDLEESGQVDRRVDVLPSSEEMERRREVGAGLTRPELGILLGASKRDLTDRLLASGLPEDPALRSLLTDAFPDAVSHRFDHLLDGHRLRRELIATELAGEIVDRLGITYVSRTAHERGCMAADVAASYWVARQVVDAPDEWRAIDDLEGAVVPALQMDLTTEIDALVDACTRAYLREMPTSGIGELIDADRKAFLDLRLYVESLRGTHAALRSGRVARWTDVGIEPELAERVVTLSELTLAPDVAGVARRLGRDVHAVADAFVTVTDRLPLDALHSRLENVTATGVWERWQARSLVDELRELRRQTAMAALQNQERTEAKGDGQDAVRTYLDERKLVTERVAALMKRFEREPDAGLAAATVVVTALRGVLD